MALVAEFRAAHTADLDAATLGAARDLVGEVFGADFTWHDWEHALGGMHVLAWQDGEPVTCSATGGTGMSGSGRYGGAPARRISRMTLRRSGPARASMYSVPAR